MTSDEDICFHASGHVLIMQGSRRTHLLPHAQHRVALLAGQRDQQGACAWRTLCPFVQGWIEFADCRNGAKCREQVPTASHFYIPKTEANNPQWEKTQVRVWEDISCGAKEREGKWIPCITCQLSCSSSCTLPSFMFMGGNSYVRSNREEQSQLLSISSKMGWWESNQN